jgi:hypothetical protein
MLRPELGLKLILVESSWNLKKNWNRKQDKKYKGKKKMDFTCPN